MSGRWPSTAACDEPESNQTSRMSRSLSNSPAPHFGQAKPSGSSCFGSCAYQASALSRSKIDGHVPQQLGAQQHLAAALAIEGRDRHAPEALARDAPVGARLDHVVDALLAPGRQPARRGDRRERLRAQRRLALVECYEPLLGGAEDDRVLAAPADRVGVGVLAGLDERARLAQQLDHLRVGLEDALARESLDLGHEAAALVHRAIDVEPVADARQVVVPAVAGCRVHDAGAGVEGDVVGEHARRVAVDPGMPEAHLLELGALRHGERRAEGEAEALLRLLVERLRQQQHLAAALHGEEGVLRLGVEREREVRRQRPGRRGPGDGGHLSPGQRRVRLREPRLLLGRQREAHVDLGALVVLVVLDLGLGERRAARDAPVDGLLGLVDEALLGEGGELAHDRRLVAGRHRQVGIGPLAHHAEPLELVALDAHELLGVLAALLPERDRRHRVLLRAQVALDLELDRQAVAVPAGPVGSVVAHHRAAAHDDVLQDLVEGGAEVDVAVGVGRPVVQHEARRALAGPAELAVEVLLLPAREPLRLGLGQVGLHREVGLREVERRAEVGLGFHGKNRSRSMKGQGSTRVSCPSKRRASG